MKKGIICLMMMMMACLVGCHEEKKSVDIRLDFQNNEFIEYGSELNAEDLIKKTNGNISNYPTIDTKTIGKQDWAFEVELDGEKKTFHYEIEVKDTQKPIIELKKNEVEIEYNGKLNINDYIKDVKDVVDGKIDYKKESDVKDTDVHYYTYHSDVKTNKAGKYSVTIKAVDKNKNMTEATIKVIVKEEKKETVQKKETPTQKKETTEKKETPVQKPEPQKETTEPKQETVSTPQQKDYSYVLTSTIEKTKIAQNTNKIVTVASTKAKNRNTVVQYFVKENGQWKEKMKVNGIVGKAGMGTGSEGATRTPIGTYYFTHAYGIKANPGSRMEYTQINDHHYWCGDQYYNQFVDDTLTDHSACSISKDEHLIDYPGSYDYFASFDYNSSNIKGKGSAYFLHCKQGSYTMGCIGVPASNMKYLLQNIDTSTALIIDLVNNVANH